MNLTPILALAVVFFFGACAENSAPSAARTENAEAAKENLAEDSGAAQQRAPEANVERESNERASAEPQTARPRTVRDFFMILPEEYFTLEGCRRETDKNCRQARLDYLKTFAEIEDTQNGYLKAGCDGAQACIEMALFRRPDNTYLVGVATSAEMMEDFYFLDYKNGKWTDVSSQAVPEFSRKNMYALPRYGTTVKVYAKKIIEQGDDYEASERGAHLYDLEWRNGKFTVKR